MECWNAVPVPLDWVWEQPSGMSCALALAQTSDREGRFLAPTAALCALPTLKHCFVPDHKGWMLGRSLCSVHKANAINPTGIPALCFSCLGHKLSPYCSNN